MRTLTTKVARNAHLEVDNVGLILPKSIPKKDTVVESHTKNLYQSATNDERRG